MKRTLTEDNLSLHVWERNSCSSEQFAINNASLKRNSKQQKNSKTFNISNNARAFSILEVLIGMSLLLLLGYFMVDMIVNQQTGISSSEVRIEGVELFRGVQSLLIDKGSCQSNFVNTVLDIDSNGGFDEKSIPMLKYKTGASAFVVGQSYGNGSVELTSLILQNKDIPSGGGLGAALLKLKYKILKGYLKDKVLIREMDVRLNTNSSGNIIDCFVDIEGMVDTAVDESERKILSKILRMNGCILNMSVSPPTITCDPAFGADCYFAATGACPAGAIDLHTFEDLGQDVCCKNLSTSAKETCVNMGGRYKEKTCATGEPTSNIINGTIPGSSITLRNCSHADRWISEEINCGTGDWIANRITGTFRLNDADGTEGIHTSFLGKYAKFFRSGVGFKASACYHASLWDTVPTTGTNLEYELQCLSSCAARCDFFESSSTAGQEFVAEGCRALRLPFDEVTRRCESPRIAPLKCKTSTAPCTGSQLELPNSEKWKACLYQKYDTKSECTAFNEATSRGKVVRLWKCIDPGCSGPTANMSEYHYYNCNLNQESNLATLRSASNPVQAAKDVCGGSVKTNVKSLVYGTIGGNDFDYCSNKQHAFGITNSNTASKCTQGSGDPGVDDKWHHTWKINLDEITGVAPEYTCCWVTNRK